MFLWQRTIGISLGLVAASSLWTVAQAYPAQEEVVETPVLIQVDDTKIVDVQVDDSMQVDDPSFGQTTTEPLVETMPTASEDVTDTIAAEAPVAEVTAVPTEVLENLSQEQLEAIASIISTAEASTSPDRIANLPTEVLTQLDALPGVEQQVGRRRWLPTGLVRRLPAPNVDIVS